MAVKPGVARGAEVVAFTTSKNKLKGIKAMGAKDVVLWDDKEAMKRHMGTLVNVGQLGTVDGLSGIMMGFGCQSLAGSNWWYERNSGSDELLCRA